MKILTSIAFFLLPVLLSGCDRDDQLSPPENSAKITLSLNIPSDIEIEPLSVMYRSDVCTTQRSKGNGDKYTLPGFHLVSMPLKTISGKYNRTLLIPYNGGSYCKWKLSNVSLRFTYDKIKFNEQLDNGLGSNLTFIFDDNEPQRDDGKYKKNTGNLILEKIFFPWIDEDYTSAHGYSKRLIAFGGDVYTTYKLKDTNKIDLTIISYPDLIVHSKGPKTNIDGSHTQFTYPDGMVTSNSSVIPDYKKLLSLIDNKRK